MTCRTCLRRALDLGQRNPPFLPATSIARAFSTRHASIGNIAGPSTSPRSVTIIRRTSYAATIRSYASISEHTPGALRGTRRSRVDVTWPSRRSASTHSVEVRTGPQHPLIITPPSLDAIKDEGYLEDDAQLLPEREAWINITPEAIAQLEKITSKESPELLAQDKLALRVGVESGGCHGYQYIMEIVEERRTDDYVMQPKDVNCIPVVVDLVSLGLLKGATLHHATELIGSSFRLQDNPQAKEGGNCGCGVSWELK